MSQGNECSFSRREILLDFGRRAHFLLTAPIAYTLLPFQSAGATTTIRPQGEGMSLNDVPGNNDPYRLPRHVIPTRYDLRLEPDLADATLKA